MSSGSRSGSSRRRAGGGPLAGAAETPSARGSGGTATGSVGAGGGGALGQEGGAAGTPDIDPCDLYLEVDLVGVRSVVASRTTIDDIMDVVIDVSDAGFEAAVCRTRPDGAFLGSLAAVEGLDQLLRCLRDRHAYTARVLEVGRTRCKVAVRRVPR